MDAQVPITPKDLARELGHTDDGRAIRHFLRSEHPEHGKYARWELTPQQAADVRAHFAR